MLLIFLFMAKTNNFSGVPNMQHEHLKSDPHFFSFSLVLALSTGGNAFSKYIQTKTIPNLATEIPYDLQSF